MAEPLTIYECPCGVRMLHQHGRHEIPGTRGRDERDRITPGTPCPHGDLAAVRVFREEDVRALYDACYDASGHSLAPDTFPAPAEWVE